MAACVAVTKSGRPCSCRAISGSDRCVSHLAPEHKAALGFGGPQPGSGRPRKPRATAIVAEAAADHAAELIAALRSAIAEGQPPKERAAAAGKWLAVASREAELERREAAGGDSFGTMARPELIVKLAERLARLQRAGRLAELPDVVEGSAVDA